MVLNPPDPAHLDIRPAKRAKTNTGASLAIPTRDPSITSVVQCPGIVSSDYTIRPMSSLSPEIQHLQGDFHFSTMSIISSSKIHQKVKNLLARVNSSINADGKSKPGVVIVEAKAAAAGKLISIIEIAKADIAKRNGTWYQYSKLRSELLPLKQKQQQSSKGSGTPANRVSDVAVSVGMSIRPQTSKNEDAGYQQAADGDDSEDDAEAFEILQHQPKDNSVRGKSKVRATPVMTIYFSCVAIPGIKALLG